MANKSVATVRGGDLLPLELVDEANKLARQAGNRRCKQAKIATARGKVLSFMRANGEWLAVVAAFSSTSRDPILSRLVPVAELKGAARRKADRWVELLA